MMKTPATDRNGHVLERILDEARHFGRQKEPFLAVFDLDSTLFDLTLRVSRIVDAFAEDPANASRFPSECAAMKNLQILRTDWGIGEALNRSGITEPTHPAFWNELHKAWAMGFFSNDYLHHDEPLPGAVEFVHELRNLGAHIMYLTGRDVQRMHEGTVRSLKATGFPLEANGIELVLKPEIRMDDAHFKVDVLKKSLETYKRIWLFENEPVNLNLCAKECPEIGLVFIESTHSGREQASETLDRIPHFEVNLEEFRRRQN
jgi:hypothetical protein